MPRQNFSDLPGLWGQAWRWRTINDSGQGILRWEELFAWCRDDFVTLPGLEFNSEADAGTSVLGMLEVE
jgi:hypothetical protein